MKLGNFIYSLSCSDINTRHVKFHDRSSTSLPGFECVCVWDSAIHPISSAPYFALMVTERLEWAPATLRWRWGYTEDKLPHPETLKKIPVNLQALVLGRRNWIWCSEETMHHSATSCGFVLTGPACLGRSVSAIGQGSTGFRIIPDHVGLGQKIMPWTAML